VVGYGNSSFQKVGLGAEAEESQQEARGVVHFIEADSDLRSRI